MDTVLNYFQQFWWLTSEMAPWLLLGFLFAGLCGSLISNTFIERHLAGNHFSSILKSVLVGIPLPICSCGIIPLAASLREKGASKGAVAAFTAATPQSGVDSILATWSLMGWTFTIARLTANFISGILAGWVINLLEKRSEISTTTKISFSPNNNSPKPCCCQQSKKTSVTVETQSTCQPTETNKVCLVKHLQKIFHEGFVKLPADLAKYLFIGLLLGAAFSTFLPNDLMSNYTEHPLLTYAVITAVAVPLYVCATGSIPFAFSLLHFGVSPGAVLVFLIAGPATNTATIVSLFKIIGKKETLIYLFLLIAVAWVSGFVLDYGIPKDWIHIRGGSSAHCTDNTFGSICAGIYVLLTANALWQKRC